MNVWSGLARGPVTIPPCHQLRLALLAIAWFATACATPHVPRQLNNAVAPPSPGLAALHLQALKDPASPDPHIGLANQYLELGNSALAEDEARTAAALAPGSANAHATLAAVLYQAPSDPKEKAARADEALTEIQRASELETGNYSYKLMAVTLALELGKLDDAEAELARLVKSDPNDARVVFDQGRLVARRHRYADALVLFERAASLEGNKRLLTFAAWAMFMAGDNAGARSLYDSLPERDYDSGDRLVLATLALRREAPDEAEAQLRARYIRPDEGPDLVSDLDLLARIRDGRLKASAVADLLEARLAQEVDDMDKAEALLRRSIEVDRRIPAAPESLAELLLFVRQDPRQALKVLSDAPFQTASYRRYHLFIQAYRALQDAVGAQEVLREFLQFAAQDVEQGRRAEARSGLETMVMILPVPSLWQFLVDLAVEDEDLSGLMDAWEQLTAAVPKLDVQFTAIAGEGLIRLARYAQAEKLLRAALLKDPTHYAVLANLALLADKRGDLTGAEEAYRRLTVIHPDQSDAWIMLGRFYLKAGKAEDARGAFEEALQREDDPPEALAGLARALSLLQMHDSAIATARRLTEVHPEDVQSWLGLARIAGEAHRYGDQEQALRQGVVRGQDQALPWNNLAWFLINVPESRYRRLEEGVVSARKAVELSDSKVATYLDTLAEGLYQSAKFPEALQLIEQAITLQPENDYLHRQRRKIRSALESASPSRSGI